MTNVGKKSRKKEEEQQSSGISVIGVCRQSGAVVNAHIRIHTSERRKKNVIFSSQIHVSSLRRGLLLFIVLANMVYIIIEFYHAVHVMGYRVSNRLRDD